MLGGFSLALGGLLLVFGVLAFFELRSVATTSTTPSPDGMYLTKIIAPELFDPGRAKANPSTLAKIAFNRIYMVGGGAFIFAMLGVLLIGLGQVKSKVE